MFLAEFSLVVRIIADNCSEKAEFEAGCVHELCTGAANKCINVPLTSAIIRLRFPLSISLLVVLGCSVL